MTTEAVRVEVAGLAIDGEVWLAAPPARVFRALTTPELLEAWWGDEAVYTTHDWQLDAHEGAPWRCEVRLANGRRHHIAGHVLEVVPERRLRLSWRPSWGGLAATEVRFELDAHDGGTRLVLHHSGFRPDFSGLETHRVGWPWVLGWLVRRFPGRTVAFTGEDMDTTTIGDFIDGAWNDHASDARAVAARLPAARPLLAREPQQLAALVQITEHVLLGHLGDADAMEPWLAEWAPLAAQQADAAPALDRARLAARLLRGGAAEPGEFPAGLVVRAHGTAVNGVAARGDLARARRLLQSAEAIARADGGVDAIKGLAASCNNLASQLLDEPRDDARDTLMLEAAHRSRRTWAEVGTWLQVERADFILALCAAKVGDGAQALAHAESCLAICEANNADAFERFFAHQALAEARRAGHDSAGARAAMAPMPALLDAIDDAGSRSYARGVLDKLQADLSAA